MGDRYVRARARVPRMLRDALWAAVERSREAAGGWLAPATVDGVIEGKPVRVLVGVSEHRLHVSVSRADVRRLRAGLSLPSWDDLVSVRACCWPDDVEVVQVLPALSGRDEEAWINVGEVLHLRGPLR